MSLNAEIKASIVADNARCANDKKRIGGCQYCIEAKQVNQYRDGKDTAPATD